MTQNNPNRIMSPMFLFNTLILVGLIRVQLGIVGLIQIKREKDIKEIELNLIKNFVHFQIVYVPIA